MAAGEAVGRGVVAAMGEAVIHSQIEPFPDDLLFRELNQWRVNDELALVFHPRAGREIRHGLERSQVIGTTIGIS